MLLIKNGYVKPMCVPDIPNGCVLIDGGKIAGVGENLPVPDGCEVIDAGGRLVTPGFVEAHCHIGLEEEGIGFEGSDVNERTDPCTPQMRAIDAVNPACEAFSLALQAGVTTACTGPGSANVVGGTFAALKLQGQRVDDMILRNPLAMKIAFGENPKRFYGNQQKSPITRMATAAILRDLLSRAQRYLADIDAAAADPGVKAPAYDCKLEAMLPVLRHQIPLKAHAHRADDIFTALRIAREFGLDITLDHCTEGHLIADILAQEHVPVFIGPSFGSKSKYELREKSFKTPSVLAKAGIKFGIITDAPVIPLQYLPLCAGLAARSGLAEDDAWKAVTLWPSELLGLSDRVGALREGLDADVVIHEKNPLSEIGAKVYRVILNGQVVV
jgi:imidazolonepropionase-like amidohydrolase